MHWIDWLLLIWLAWYAWEGYRRGSAAWRQLLVMVLAMTAAGLVWKYLLAALLGALSPLIQLSLLLLLFLAFVFLLGLLLEQWSRLWGGEERDSPAGFSGLAAGCCKWLALLIIFLLLTRLLNGDNQLALLLQRSTLLRWFDLIAAWLAPGLGLAGLNG